MCSDVDSVVWPSIRQINYYSRNRCERKNDKVGQIVKNTGNVHFHYITTCLKENDQNFSFNPVTVTSRKIKILPKGSTESLAAKRLQVEPAADLQMHSLHSAGRNTFLNCSAPIICSSALSQSCVP